MNRQDDIAYDQQFCNTCIKTLQGIYEYRKKCLESFYQLNNDIEQKILDVDLINIKSEPGVLDFKDESTETKTPLKIELVENHSGIQFELEDENIAESFKQFEGNEINDNNEKSSYCSICVMFFSKGINRHVVQKHCSKTKSGKVKCKVCNKSYSSQKTFYSHFKYHRNYKNAKGCTICGGTFKNMMDYELHVRNHTTIISGKDVNKMRKGSRKQKKVSTCIKMPSEVSDYTCDRCNARYSQLDRLRSHIVIKHLGGFQCKYCRRGYLDENEYNEHMKIESSKKREKQYVCDTCGYTGKYRAYLLEHIKRFQ